MRFLDLFAGIGGFRLGMEMAGHECVGYVEIDKFARKSYETIHNTEGEWTANDITSVTDNDIRELGRKRGQIHVICGGFPCQSFSIAGKRGGFNDTRGTLFFEIMRFASILRPRYLFLENVEGLLNHDRGDTFEVILRTLDEVGYDAEWDLLNSKDFGVPQNRERVFIIGHLRGERTRKVFPLDGENRETSAELKLVGLLDMKGNESIRRVYDAVGIAPTLTTMAGGNSEPKILVNVDHGTLKPKQVASCLDANYFKGLDNHQARTGVLEIRPVLTPDREEKRQNGRRMKEPGEPMFTLTAQDKHGIYDGYRIRKLTPRECWRLQGFPDWAFDRAQAAGVSDSQLYKQAGNSVTVNVIYEIAKRLVSEDDKEE